MSKCKMLQNGVCKECENLQRISCVDLKNAFEAGRKEGLGRLNDLGFCEFEDSWGRLVYAIWNKNIATENDMRHDLLLYPDGRDPRILYVEKRTWDLVFGVPIEEPYASDSKSDDPYEQVKIANSIIYYGANSVVPERGQIVDVIRPSDDCPNGKIWVNLRDRTLRVPFNAIGKILFFSEMDLYAAVNRKA